jgi:hypothetical protein
MMGMLHPMKSSDSSVNHTLITTTNTTNTMLPVQVFKAQLE